MLKLKIVIPCIAIKTVCLYFKHSWLYGVYSFCITVWLCYPYRNTSAGHLLRLIVQISKTMWVWPRIVSIKSTVALSDPKLSVACDWHVFNAERQTELLIIRSALTLYRHYRADVSDTCDHTASVEQTAWHFSCTLLSPCWSSCSASD